MAMVAGIHNASHRALTRFQRWVAMPLSVIASVILFAMMALTLMDVVGRYLFDTPVSGAFEMTELMLASVIFMGLPLVTAERDHVTVDIIDLWVSPAVVKNLKRVAGITGTIAFGFLGIMLWQLADKLAHYGDTTAVLQIPHSWLAWLMAVMTLMSAAAMAIITLIDLLGHYPESTA